MTHYTSKAKRWLDKNSAPDSSGWTKVMEFSAWLDAQEREPFFTCKCKPWRKNCQHKGHRVPIDCDPDADGEPCEKCAQEREKKDPFYKDRCECPRWGLIHERTGQCPVKDAQEREECCERCKGITWCGENLCSCECHREKPSECPYAGKDCASGLHVGACDCRTKEMLKSCDTCGGILESKCHKPVDDSHICDDDCWTVPGKCMIVKPKEKQECEKVTVCGFKGFGVDRFCYLPNTHTGAHKYNDYGECEHRMYWTGSNQLCPECNQKPPMSFFKPSPSKPVEELRIPLGEGGSVEPLFMVKSTTDSEALMAMLKKLNEVITAHNSLWARVVNKLNR